MINWLIVFKVSVKENEVPTEENSSRYKGKLYIKLKLKDQITL